MHTASPVALPYLPRTTRAMRTCGGISMRTLHHVLTRVGICTILLFSIPTIASAATVSGTVRDAESGHPLVGANVYLDDTPFGAACHNDGAFEIHGVPAGTYVLTTSFVGYSVQKTSVIITSDGAIVDASLNPEVLRGQTVVVTATRAKVRESPVAFSNLTRAEIGKRYFAQDVPMLLKAMPSVHAYSDAGNGIGYSYLKIRGFDQKRINVLINGIPHNGPTSHEVYWIDMPDLLANAEDVQIQRGVGSSLHGSNALGGTVNIITSNFSVEPRVTAYAGSGSFDTRKYSLAYNSGLVGNHYVMYGRYSRITSNGYRDQSWTKLWSYFLGIARYDETMTTKFNVYGGPERTHLSYYGIPRLYLDGEITGDARVDRKYNPLTYANETDDFNQPHYELHNDWQISDKVRLSNTLYTIKGEGDYDQYRSDRNLEEFRLPTFSIGDSDVVRSDLIRNRFVQNDEWGWLPRAEFTHGNGSLTVGGEVRLHKGNHVGSITWLASPPPGTEPDYVYYQYRENKRTISAFIHEEYRPVPFITLMGDVQAVSHTYELSKDRVTNYAHDTSFRWIAPKAGVNVNLSDRVNVFASIAHTRREPIMSDLVDPQDFWNVPNFTTVDTSATGTVQLSGPTVDPERLLDVELGIGYRSERINVTANVYRMDLHNEIVPWVGQINEASGLPATGNADRSVHEGIEIDLATQPFTFLEFGGNVSINNDHFVEYTENAMDWNAWQVVPVDRGGNRIALFPEMLANIHTTVTYSGASAGLTWRYVGRQYLDNSESVDWSIAPYNTTDLTLSYEFGSHFGLAGLRAELQVTNLFDQLYAAGGYMDDIYADASTGVVHGTPYFIPAATRSVFAGMRWEF
jgi:iron complex outermembrane recepter protein